MKNKLFLLSALALSVGVNMATVPAAVAALPGQIQGQQLPSLAPMLEKVLPAVVSVHVEGTEKESQQQIPDQLKRFFGQDGEEGAPGDDKSQEFEGLASGVIIDAAKGYVLTNNHVVNGADKISVQLSDGREFTAKLVGHDEQTDIALIQLIDAKNLTQIKIADSDQLKVGDFTVAIGNPFGLGQTATSGIVSALGRSGLNLEGLENFIQTDAAINRGNSGGALVNLNGELIGLNTAILASSGGNIGIGFAIPSNMAMGLAQQLIQFGEVKRGQLGIKGTEMTADMAKAFKVDIQHGAFVNEVLPQSAAAKAGIKAGDIITSVDGKNVANFAELRVKIGTTPPGQEVKVGLLRDGKPVTVTVKLDNSSQTTASAELMTPALQGATLSDGAAKDGTKGVKVDEVAKATPAAQFGLQKDDVIVGVNRTPVQNLAELRKLLETKPDLLALSIMRGDENIYLLLR
ncbi:serine endoprotease DegQ [bacteria symbiont BFo1 of Frankliniella occidentalis]|jgi:serine protease DegQ|uniref:Serine endoprotease DegQ n=1 Tax=Erwinia aphidicola TaxID=68334 RepID=A0ABU8DG38_ERWAP|nr:MULTISPECIES: serine endoprotease DegQ [Erwinia]KMV72822.1 serine endoprotease DegQ [bacteria symbiont BFo1 of Frankliniella occidentalis]PIJ59159.1 serine endoprotease DegQ [Erwinia sp. OLMDLW33]KYP86577.1 serine endoprotease DegQ [bacteria symbiont BFo1 of Frankliniella occidentalis]KYP92269.1 serine endoprotease DegQ [bacteria symbiont BFo1 of Frankliniella occidentalis]MBD1376011.1 Do family serine endopeptidase [Erwinia aphidicola]